MTLIGRSFLLVRHPVVLAKLRSEISSVIPEGQQVTRAHIAKVPFLRCVINESESTLFSAFIGYFRLL
jgi:hypothetical protein